MGITLTVPGVTAPASSAANSHYQLYDDLVGARWGGSNRPDVSNSKKGLLKGTFFGGTPTIAGDYHEFNAASEYMNTGLIPTSTSFALVIVFQTQAATGASTAAFLGNTTGATPLAAPIVAGDLSVAVVRAANPSVRSTTFSSQTLIATLIGAQDAITTMILSFDSVGLTTHMELYASGGRVSTQTGVTALSQAMRMREINLGILLGTSFRVYHAALINRNITIAEGQAIYAKTLLPDFAKQGVAL
jgi:hypothetical protein